MMHIKSESPTTILWTETCQHLLCFEVDFLSVNNHVLNNNTTTSHFLNKLPESAAHSKLTYNKNIFF